MGVTAGEPRRLTCGRTVDSVVDAALEPGVLLDAHQQQCPYCRSAVRSMRQRWSTLVTLDEVPVPAGLVDRMVGRVRSAMAEPGHVRVSSAQGQLRIARAVIEDMVRQVVTEHGLAVRDCRVVDTPDGLSVDVRVVMRHGTAAPRIAERARRAVIARVAEWVGMDVAKVDVAVIDIDLD